DTRMSRAEAARTYIRRFGVIGDTELLALLHELAEAAAATVEAQGVPRSEQATTYHVDLRYHGQGFEITVPAEVAAFDGNGSGLAQRAAACAPARHRLFSFLLEGNEHELVSARATVTGPRPGVGTVRLPDGGPDPSAARARTTRIWVDGAHADTAVYDRTALRAGNV